MPFRTFKYTVFGSYEELGKEEERIGGLEILRGSLEIVGQTRDPSVAKSFVRELRSKSNGGSGIKQPVAAGTCAGAIMKLANSQPTFTYTEVANAIEAAGGAKGSAGTCLGQFITLNKISRIGTGVYKLSTAKQLPKEKARIKKRPIPKGGCFEAILKLANSQPSFTFSEAVDAVVAVGADKGSAGRCLTQLVRREQIERIDKGTYQLAAK